MERAAASDIEVGPRYKVQSHRKLMPSPSRAKVGWEAAGLPSGTWSLARWAGAMRADLGTGALSADIGSVRVVQHPRRLCAECAHAFSLPEFPCTANTTDTGTGC